MIVAGIGSRKGVSATEVIAAVEAALKEHGLEQGRLGKLATMEFKRGEVGIFEAGEMMGLEVVVVPSLHEQTPESAHEDGPPPLAPPRRGEGDHAGASAGVASVSEAAALAAAGEGARLAGPRIAVGRVTCAIAFGDDG